MEPGATGEEEEDEDDDDDDEECGEYYSKCRAPMRKLPALIQYWIDTGNPPYQLVGDDDHSETGSSLSEGEHSRTGHSEVFRESSDEQKREDGSPCSSVDTAAYILSNTNVTKKSETMAIVEGAKRPEEPQIATVSPRKDKVVAEKITDVGRKNNSSLSIKPDVRLIKKLTQHSPAPPCPTKPIAEYDIRTFTTPPKNSAPDGNFSSPKNSLSLFSPSQRSVKLSEVLPTFRQFDELLDVSRAATSTRARLSLSRVRQKPKLVVSSTNDETPPALQSSQASSILPNNLIKPHNRRKLYTGRNSPVDLTLTIARTSIGSVHKTGNCLHPALEPETTEKLKTSDFPNRARARRKRKRASQAAERVGNEDNTSHESVPPIPTEKVKSDMRYSDFFESLGLTPSKTIMGANPVSKPIKKRPRKIHKRAKLMKPKKNGKIIEDIDTSIKDTGQTSQCTEGSGFSPLGRRSSVNDAANKLPMDKILVVRLYRLSDDLLARYKRRDDSDESEKKLESSALKNAPDVATSSAGSSPVDKMGKAFKNENIELLTTATHDSDSSTILICSCNNDNNGQCSDSDKSLFTNDRSKRKKKSLLAENVQGQRSLRSAEHKSPVRMNAEVTRNLEQPANNSQKSKIHIEGKYSPDNAWNKKILEKSPKLPRVLVRLDKLDLNDLSKSTKIGKSLRESQKLIIHNNNNNNSNNNNQNASSFSSTMKSLVEDGNEVGFLGLSSSSRSPEARNKLVTIGSRGPKNFDENPVRLQKSRATPVRCNWGISISSVDEEEDSFAKLIKEFGSARRSVQIETDALKKISSDELVDDAADDRVAMPKSRMFRHRGNFGISMSSDEEDEEATKPVKKAQLKRQGRVERNAGAAKEMSCRKTKNLNRCLPAELRNGQEGVKSNDKLDESNRRKVSSVEKTHENFGTEAKGREVVKRSTRNKKSPPSGDSGERFEDNDQSPASKPRWTRSMFAKAKESNLDGDKALPSWTDRKPEWTSAEPVANETSQFSKSKSRNLLFSKVARPVRHGKLSVRGGLHLARFKTRLDSDSDTDFETLRFSVNRENDQRSGKARASVNETQIEKLNTEVSEQNVPPRSFQKLIDRRMEFSRKKLKGANTSDKNMSDDSQKNSNPTKNGAARVPSASDNRLSSSDEVATFVEPVKTRNSCRKQKNMKLTTVSRTKNLTSTRLLGTLVEHKSDDDVKLTDGKADSDVTLQREKFVYPNSTSAKKKSGEQSSSRKRRGEQLSPIVKKKPRRTILLGTPVEYESDGDGEPTDGKVESGETLQLKKIVFPNSASSKKINVEHDSSIKRRSPSKKLFSNSPEEDSVEEIDLMFGCDTRLAVKKCTVSINNLKFVSGNKHRNLNSIKRSTMSFRTKLRWDSDDEDNVL